MDELNELFERLSAVQDKINVNAVFGEPQTVEGHTLIPVAEVMVGMGVGFGSGPSGAGCTCECEGDEACEAECECPEEEQKDAMGGGGGAGGRAHPIAYIDVSPEGVHIQPVVNEQRIALAGILMGAWAVGWVGLVLKTLFAPRR